MSRNGLARDPSLVPLSRDHHDALFQALELRRAEGSPRVARGFLDFFHEELEGHMADEEDVVLPAAQASDPTGAERIRVEHAQLRDLAAGLAADLDAGQDPRARMEGIARLLHDHVRYEEREFFMGVQAALSPEALAGMGTALEAHRAARGVAASCRIRAR